MYLAFGWLGLGRAACLCNSGGKDRIGAVCVIPQILSVYYIHEPQEIYSLDTVPVSEELTP